MCFGKPFTSYSVPSSPRGTNANYRNAHCLAPYFTDLNPVTKGNVSYKIYDNVINDIDAAIVDLAKQLVLDVHDVAIEPDMIVTATWVDVLKHGDSVSSIRVLPVKYPYVNIFVKTILLTFKKHVDQAHHFDKEIDCV